MEVLHLKRNLLFVCKKLGGKSSKEEETMANCWLVIVGNWLSPHDAHFVSWMADMSYLDCFETILIFSVVNEL